MADTPPVAVLAAGRGSRFGGDKLDALCAGRPVAQWVLEAVSGASLLPGLLVVPPRSVLFADAAHGWTLRINQRADEGLGTSVALAAEWALEVGATQLLILLADMPLISPEYLRCLSAASSPVATAYPDGRAGVPALLSQSLLRKAAMLSGDRGAASLFADAAGLTLMEPPAGMLLDVDRPDDLALAEAALLARKSAFSA